MASYVLTFVTKILLQMSWTGGSDLTFSVGGLCEALNLGADNINGTLKKLPTLFLGISLGIRLY